MISDYIRCSSSISKECRFGCRLVMKIRTKTTGDGAEDKKPCFPPSKDQPSTNVLCSTTPIRTTPKLQHYDQNKKTSMQKNRFVSRDDFNPDTLLATENFTTTPITLATRMNRWKQRWKLNLCSLSLRWILCMGRGTGLRWENRRCMEQLSPCWL